MLENDLVKIKPLTTEKELIYAAYECQLSDEQKKKNKWLLML